MRGYRLSRGDQGFWRTNEYGQQNDNGEAVDADAVDEQRFGTAPEPVWPHTGILFDQRYQAAVQQAIDDVPVDRAEAPDGHRARRR